MNAVLNILDNVLDTLAEYEAFATGMVIFITTILIIYLQN